MNQDDKEFTDGTTSLNIENSSRNSYSKSISKGKSVTFSDINDSTNDTLTNSNSDNIIDVNDDAKATELIIILPDGFEKTLYLLITESMQGYHHYHSQ